MSSDLWIGVAISVPVGIASGLAVQPIQRWWDKRRGVSHASQLKQERRDYHKVIDFALHPELLCAQLVMRSITMIGILLALSVGDKFAQYFDRHPIALVDHLTVRIPQMVSTSIAVGVSIFTIVTVYRYVSHVYDIYYNVRFFEKYIEQVPEEIRNKELEQTIVAIRARGN